MTGEEGRANANRSLPSSVIPHHEQPPAGERNREVPSVLSHLLWLLGLFLFSTCVFLEFTSKAGELAMRLPQLLNSGDRCRPGGHSLAFSSSPTRQGVGTPSFSKRWSFLNCSKVTPLKSIAKLVVFSPWGHKESDTTEPLSVHAV